MNIYIFAFVCCVLFLIFKFVLNKYINKENKPIKPLLKDSIIIFIIIIISNLLYKNYLGIELKNNEISVFTDAPNF